MFSFVQSKLFLDWSFQRFPHKSQISNVLQICPVKVVFKLNYYNNDVYWSFQRFPHVSQFSNVLQICPVKVVFRLTILTTMFIETSNVYWNFWCFPHKSQLICLQWLFTIGYFVVHKVVHKYHNISAFIWCLIGCPQYSKSILISKWSRIWIEFSSVYELIFL